MAEQYSTPAPSAPTFTQNRKPVQILQFSNELVKIKRHSLCPQWIRLAYLQRKEG